MLNIECTTTLSCRVVLTKEQYDNLMSKGFYMVVEPELEEAGCSTVWIYALSRDLRFRCYPEDKDAILQTLERLVKGPK